LLERGQGIRTIQELRGHGHGDTKMIYAHVPNGGTGVISLRDDALAVAPYAENR
jgi:site-specific recombinase XerC